MLKFLEDTGGLAVVSRRITRRPKTLREAAREGVFPAQYYLAFCLLAKEHGLREPPHDWFSFAELRPNTA